MKNKKNKPLTLYCTILAAVVVFFLTACVGGDSKKGDIHYPTFTSIKKAEQYLASHGNTVPDPGIVTGPGRARLQMKIDLGDLSKPDNNYLRLLEAVESAGKYVYLDLSRCKMGGTKTFTSVPFDEAPPGADYIIELKLPKITESIKADVNGQSPFFYYKNLYSFNSYDDSTHTFWGPAEIGDSAFSYCKNLEFAPTWQAKFVGNNAFRGCEKLEAPRFLEVESIGDNAFFDCSSLNNIIFGSQPPVLGEGVFLGSTSGNLRIRFYTEEDIEIYRAWLDENLSKFNNNGEDVEIYALLLL